MNPLIEYQPVAAGIHWVAIPETGLKLLCGSPADAVKHLRKKGLVKRINENGASYETGPNAILLSDWAVQNGGFANLTEFPVLQMLYLQGMIIPNHPNNKGIKPLLIGHSHQLASQLQYIYRGNYGLISEEELVKAGISEEKAKTYMDIKLNFAFGKINSPENLLDCLALEDQPIEISKGVTLKRLAPNQFEVSYKNESQRIDLRLAPKEQYAPPYQLDDFFIRRETFAIIHSGSGDGWDIRRPCMASILMHKGKVYLVDAGPNILESLHHLSISVNEVAGIFHTHAHDDHFAGLTSLIRTDQRFNYFSSPMVRQSVTKKLCALLDVPESSFSIYFDVHDLPLGKWSEFDGLEIKPAYSPHPIETNVFFFRSNTDPKKQVYAHFADIVSERVWKPMGTEKAMRPIPQTQIDEVLSMYQTPSHIKKIDAGGGMIHGDAQDFEKDDSKKIILAHTSGPASEEQLKYGNEAPFGSTNIIIKAKEDYSHLFAQQWLNFYFPNIKAVETQRLLSFPFLHFERGAKLINANSTNNHIYLTLSGTAEYTDQATGKIQFFPSGSLIGLPQLLDTSHQPLECRATSRVEVLQIPTHVFQDFISKNELGEKLTQWQEMLTFLWNTWLFGEVISYPVLIGLIRQATWANEFASDETVYLVKEGNAAYSSEKIRLDEGDFFGSEAQFISASPSLPDQLPQKALAFPVKALINIPILYWKLLETYQQRFSI